MTAQYVFRALSGLGVLTVLSGIPAALAATQRVYVKSQAVSAKQMDADRDACVQKALAFVNGPGKPSSRPTGSLVGEELANAIDMRGPKAAMNFEIGCMTDLGYVLLPVTPDEDKALSRARGTAARDQWYDDFVANDLMMRIASARSPRRP